MIDSRFEGYVCWRRERVLVATETIATEIARRPQDLFAIHAPMKLTVEQGGRKTETDEHGFLELFCDKRRRFVFAPVTGDSGTGKSHLLCWVQANLPSTAKRRVIMIPKVDVNLRDVIDKILGGMEGPEFDRYRAKLASAQSDLSNLAVLREELLNSLSVAVGVGANVDEAGLSEDEVYLKQNLPDLLRDVYLKHHWLKKGGIVDRLVVSTLGRHEHPEDTQTRTEFRQQDLPLEIANITQAARRVQDFFATLTNDPALQIKAVDWLNRHISAAVERVLNFTGSDLKRLLRDVRETLQDRGMELVLLIEDFTILQGVDRALLDALLVEPEQGERTLCPIRTALACTTGYFNTLGDTVRTRITFQAQLKATPETAGADLLDNVCDFVSRRLNLARLSDREVDDWYDRASGENMSKVCSACTECPHQAVCFRGFGEVGGRGLYPLSRTAVKNLYESICRDGVYRPRAILRALLRPILDDSESIRTGHFPSPGVFLEGLGRTVSLDGPEVLDDVDRLDRKDAVRRKVLIDIWAERPVDRLTNLDQAIHDAFRIPPLDLVGRPEPPRLPERSDRPPDVPQWPPRELSADLDAIKRWGEGKPLLENTRKKLSALILDRLSTHVPWDDEGLLRESLVGTGASYLLRPTGIDFLNHAGDRPSATNQVVLVIPIRGPRALPETSLALRGLMLFEREGDWSFPDGTGRRARSYALRLLDECADEALRQLRHPTLNREALWDPVPSCVEVLATYAGMTGRPVFGSEVVEQVDSLFRTTSASASSSSRAGTWQSLVRSLADRCEVVLRILRSRVTASKGGSLYSFIDPTQIVITLDRLRTDWRLTSPPPRELPLFYRPLTDSHVCLRQFEDALSGEVERHLTWLSTLQPILEGVGDTGAFVDSVKSVAADAAELGCFRCDTMRHGDWVNRIDSVRQQDIPGLLRAVDDLRETDAPAELMAVLGRGFDREVAATEEFVRLVTGFVASTSACVKEQLAIAGGGDSPIKEIAEILTQLKEVMSELS